MSEKHINKSLLPCGGGLGVGIIPQGYKQTSIGIIPQDWEVVRLGEVTNFFSGGTPLTTNRNYYNGTIPFIKSAEIYFDTTQEFLTDEGLQNSSAKWVSKGDLLFALYGANSGEVAISKIDGVINQAVLCIKNDIKISDATFLYNYFLMIKRYLVAKFLQGGQGNLSAQIIKSLQIPLPPLKEQEKIARILGVWDSALDTLANLIKAKRKYKTALMQRLLTPPKDIDCHDLPKASLAMTIEPRHCEEALATKQSTKESLRFAGFSDKWQEFRLGDLLEYEQPTKYIVKNTEYSDSYQTPVLTAGKSFILGKTNETFGIYNDLPIILFDDFMATSQFVDFPFKVKSSASKILKTKNDSVNLRIVFETMQMIDFCAENHKRYWISEYQNLKIKLPTLAEQKKIAQVLSVCDKEIETLNLKFECLKAQKKGLMQQLLSGKIRVKC